MITLYLVGKIWRNKKKSFFLKRHKSHLSKIPSLPLFMTQKTLSPSFWDIGNVTWLSGPQFPNLQGTHLIIFKTASHSMVNWNCIALIHICTNQFVLLASYSPSKDLGDWNAEQVSFLLGKAECHKERLELVGAIQRNNSIRCEHTYLIFSKSY